MIRIAVDAMGGDHAPATIVEGAVAAGRALPVALTLVGPAERLRDLLAAQPETGSVSVRVVESGEAVGMAEPPTAALRRRPDASVRVAIAEVAQGRADALFSAGNTGATVIASYAGLGMLRGADRPAIATTIPTRRGAAVLLDIGANVECRPQHLVQFAAMGTVFARVALGLDRPRVALLSIGEEESKGNELTREAHRLLKGGGLHFAGNVEARDVYAGEADVIVCDGFTGNIALKVSEGLVEMIGEVLREEAGPGTNGSPADVFGVFEKRAHHDEYGAAPLLGVAGLVLIGHGRSSARAVRNGIAMAYRFAASDFIARVQEELVAAGVTHR